MTKNVLITGASSGIGLATGVKLREAGFNVIGTGRDPVKSQHGEFKMVSLDVCDDHSVQTCVKDVISEVGEIDILINNAGLALVSNAEHTPIADAQLQLETNYLGAVRMIQAVLPNMRAKRSGKIINISSLVGFASIPYMAAYSASKFALEGFSEALYHELLPFGVQVALVQPGMVKTTLFEKSNEHEPADKDYQPWFEQARLSIIKHAVNGVETDVVANRIVKLCQQKRPDLHNRVGPDAKLVGRLKRILPGSVFNKIWYREFGLNEVKA